MKTDNINWANSVKNVMFCQNDERCSQSEATVS